MAKQPIMLSLTDQAMNLLNMNASARKRGELVSKLIETYVTEDGIRDTSPGILERMEKRLIEIETHVVDVNSSIRKSDQIKDERSNNNHLFFSKHGVK
ncbi:MAG: hypothetical protein KC421_30050 [Anaerolineales bacterium]|nr:hypothetical protein [Anaerolineales bacterium]